MRIESVDFEPGRPTPGSPYFHCLEIRRIVFTEGQGVSLELEFDGLDEEAQHFLAFDEDRADATPVGVARMRRVGPNAKAERVAVLDAQRSSGVGRALMQAIEARARALRLAAIVLNAQVAVIPFYEKLGYVAHGEIFEEADIPHRSMTKPLDPATD